MALKVGASLPTFDNSTAWLNFDVPSEDLSSLVRGKYCIVHFWAKSCPACKANMPLIQRLRDRYTSRSLQTIAVHMPRGPLDLDIDAVRTVVEQMAITEPCAIDNEHKIGARFEVKAWPTYYLFDQSGLLKRHAAGGFGVKMIEAALKDIFSG